MTDEEAIQAAQTAHDAQNPNIITGSVPLPRETSGWTSSSGLGIFENHQQMEKFWGHPASQFAISIARDPAFRGAVGEINQKFDKNVFFGSEIAWVLLIWIFQAWRISKAGSWIIRIWAQAYCSIIFFWGSLFLIPWILWGNSYQMALLTVFRALAHLFWA